MLNLWVKRKISKNVYSRFNPEVAAYITGKAAINLRLTARKYARRRSFKNY